MRIPLRRFLLVAAILVSIITLLRYRPQALLQNFAAGLQPQNETILKHEPTHIVMSSSSSQQTFVFDTSTSSASSATNATIPEAETADSSYITQTNTTADKTIHQEGIAVLPLFPWEERAIQMLSKGYKRCQPPKGVHKTCCPGSFSRGGEVTAQFREDCSHADFEQIHHAARQFADSWPAQSNTCDICRIVEILRRRNEPLIVMGDSMTMQAYDGLHCELERRQYLVESSDTMRPLWTSGWGNIKGNSTLIVKSPTWAQGEFVIVHLFFVYSVPLVIAEEAAEINQAGGILWFNFGLHDGGNRLSKLESDMRSFFAALKANSTFSLVLFRETTAQHYDTPSGLYHFLPHRSLECSSLEWTGEVGRRDQAVRNAALAVGYDLVSPERAMFGDRNKMVVLPFHNYTAELHAGHPNDHGPYNNITRGECTHLCSTPLLWVPLWRTLRIALDAAFSSH
jgi:hypothetical protein